MKSFFEIVIILCLVVGSVVGLNALIHRGQVQIGSLKPGQCFDYALGVKVLEQGAHSTLYLTLLGTKHTLSKDTYVEPADCPEDFKGNTK